MFLLSANITSGQSNLIQKAALLPHMDASIVFARWRQCAPHIIHASLDPPESTSQTGSRSVQPFFAHPTADSPYTL